MPDGRVKGKKPLNSKISKVNELIQEGNWNEELLSMLFDKDTTKEIQKLPLTCQGMKDRVY